MARNKTMVTPSIVNMPMSNLQKEIFQKQTSDPAFVTTQPLGADKIDRKNSYLNLTSTRATKSPGRESGSPKMDHASTPMCKTCGFVMGGSGVCVSGNHYHKQCFFCSHCMSPIQSDAFF
eukprot:TRINITY_DN2255_c0_g1_i1.p3 TRINITY_DN2255_c0_g1~~TRINITY_DN2255_c0_g1_i1.p3  ORF type:complete len:120 (+),score=0.32 TRINITY_DN2255_c0_g1_i1:594-953(+)